MPLGNPSGPFYGVSAWKREVEQRARMVDPTLNLLIDNDYENSSASSTFTQLGGTVTFDTGVTGGVARLKTAAIASSTAAVFNSGGSDLVGAPLNESWYAQARCWIKNVPVGTSTNYCIGLQDTTGATAQFITWGLFAQYSDTYLTLLMSINDGSVVDVTSNFPADLNGFHDYGIGRDVTNDKLYTFVDGMPIMELDGPFAKLTANPCYFYSAVGGDSALFGQVIELWADNIATVVKRAS